MAGIDDSRQFIPLKIAVLTVSDTRSRADDTSGDTLVARIEAVTVDSARAAGRALISRGRPALSVLGPGPGLESAATIAESLARRAA